ncbi:MAG: exonuclease domain-containing protein [Clostridium sp.]|uniref:3'-5' exonuclease n=1 Tax=Clostridium sp. TaxID=1506 RepID=UPI0025B8BCC1|nr:3'-5' exonuclease [Clostridium sp.]MCF0146793.1 exonuclease domain-containing protein [Clostridium sp.]
MKYIIFDLEFNQSSNKEDKIPQLPFEIIQIGALKLDEDFKTISTFNELVKPTVYKNIIPYVQELTKITEEILHSAKNFTDIYYDFTNFIGNEEVTFVIWGLVDLRELYKNIIYFNLPTENLPKLYIDIQHYASKHFNIPHKKSIGLKNALNFLNIHIESEFHNAFNDAYYTAEIFKELYTDSIESKVYSHTPIRIKSEPKKIVNYDALILQIEKMYNKKLNSEEISMIKLAYNMGKTHQFLIKDDESQN